MSSFFTDAGGWLPCKDEVLAISFALSSLRHGDTDASAVGDNCRGCIQVVVQRKGISYGENKG